MNRLIGYRSLEEAWLDLCEGLKPGDPSNEGLRELFFSGAMVAFTLSKTDRGLGALKRDIELYVNRQLMKDGS
jgi:hypothetical protein